MQVRRIVKNRDHFPSDQAADELLFLALRNVAKKGTMPQRTRKEAANQVAIVFAIDSRPAPSSRVSHSDLTHKSSDTPMKLSWALVHFASQISFPAYLSGRRSSCGFVYRLSCVSAFNNRFTCASSALPL